jgi:cell division protein FtsB
MAMLFQSRARLLFIGCLFVAGYFVYSAVAGAIQSQRLTDERNQANTQVQTLTDKKAYLEGVRQYVASDAYVEQVARRQLGYVRDGEVPFIVVSPAPAQDALQPGDWWQRLFPK